MNVNANKSKKTHIFDKLSKIQQFVGTVWKAFRKSTKQQKRLVMKLNHMLEVLPRTI